jgi:hypothetical protein
LERLTALSRFVDEDLVLAKLTLLPELDGKRIQDLESRMRRRFEDAPLSLMMLGAAADRALVVDIFDRLNVWKPLGVEEVRGFLDAQRSG